MKVYVLTKWLVDGDGHEYWKHCRGVFATREAAIESAAAIHLSKDEEWEIIDYEVQE